MVDAKKREFQAHTAAMIQRSRENREDEAGELFAVPQVELVTSVQAVATNSSTVATSPISAVSPPDQTIKESPILADMPRIRKHRRANTGETPVKAVASSSSSSRQASPKTGSSSQAGIDLEKGVVPEWYSKAKLPPRPGADERRTWDKLTDFVKLISAIQSTATENHTGLKILTQKLYIELDSLRFTDVTPFGLKRAKLFDPERGLPRIYGPDAPKYPYYIISDAKGLHKRWLAKILDGSNMFRGIKNMVKGDNKGQGPSIDDDYKMDWHFHGEGHLVNSDWFANQLCAVRDGAHGSAQGGISGIKEMGAVSISMSGDMYKDTDVGPSCVRTR